MTCNLILKNKRPKVTHMDGFLCSLMMRFDFEQLFTNRNHNDFCYYIPFPIFTQTMALDQNHYILILVDSIFIVVEKAKIYFDWHIRIKERGCCQCFASS